MISQITIEVRHQGAPVLDPDSLCIVKQGDGFIAAEISMHSKWCLVSGMLSGSDGTLGFFLSAQDRSLHLHETASRDAETLAVFRGVSWDAWDLFSVDCERYTVRFVLLQKSKSLQVNTP